MTEKYTMEIIDGTDNSLLLNNKTNKTMDILDCLDELNELDKRCSSLSEYADKIDDKVIAKNHRIEYLEKELNKVKSLINYKISDITVSNEYGDVHEDLTMFAQQVLINLKKDMGW